MSADASVGSSTPAPATVAPASTPITPKTPQQDQRKKVDDVAALLRGEGRTQKPNGEAASSRASPDRSRPDDDSTPLSSARPADDIDEFEDDPESEDRPKRGKSLKEIAEEHGLSIRSLQKALTDAVDADGNPLTLGQLREHYREHSDYQAQRDDFDVWKMDAQNEVMQARRQVQDVLNTIKSIVPPQTLARAFADMDNNQRGRIEKAKAQVLEYYPEWRDAAVMTQARDKLVEYVSDYGFNKYELGSIDDPRLIKLLEDSRRIKAQLKRLREGGQREQKPTREAPSRKGHRPSTSEQADALAAAGNKAGAIALLIKGGSK